ncbi:radical SAM protein [Nostoc linckia z18]|jgi:radical SAM protein with 4Fe4S-binding SPASM domain|uniref:Radical SAM protein n=2 Tax=Nostoc linckia TaxID=92942 RepID=A0A9Q5ZB89_NOSLI|nr:radical SAM protein [Nostoc linckia]PHK28109.1 radical SAM protein [Nostoc linckia z15]PHK44972.1 radical SAM protein [Nostoc linckia z16]PHJ66161.1 radical SAM protein [Nostoc linckia z3]PHJ68755.1 radical SAM protein [Nostoc linckia z1]PHJ74065.1 radical SAM protein [Nostoc linckia z2]
MIIKDTQKLLPKQIQIDYEMPDMVLEIPPHGISLHPKSIEKLLATAKSTKRPVAFRPTLSILAELGLPPYPTLAYLYRHELSNSLQQPLWGLETQTQANFSGLIPFTYISQIDIDEQIHYFADYYAIAIKPLYIRAIIGNSCNLKCVMCPYHSPLLKPTHTTNFFKDKKMMSWKMMEKLAKECGKAGVAISVGSVEEPILHPNIVDFIQLSKESGVPKFHLTTNGQLLNENKAQALLEAGLTSLDVSIDAAEPETYLKIRGGNLNTVESNILNFIKVRDRLDISCEVRTSFVRNLNVTPEEEQKFQERWLAKTDGVLILNLAQYQETNMRLKTTNNTIDNSLQYYINKAQGRWPCLFPFTEMAVLPDGRIYYCIETLFRLGFDGSIESLGNYNQQNLQEIWSGNLFQKLRSDLILNQLSNRSVCQNCDMWKSQFYFRSSTNKLQIITTTVTEIYQKIDSNNI